MLINDSEFKLIQSFQNQTLKANNNNMKNNAMINNKSDLSILNKNENKNVANNPREEMVSPKKNNFDTQDSLNKEDEDVFYVFDNNKSSSNYIEPLNKYNMSDMLSNNNISNNINYKDKTAKLNMISNNKESDKEYSAKEINKRSISCNDNLNKEINSKNLVNINQSKSKFHKYLSNNNTINKLLHNSNISNNQISSDAGKKNNIINKTKDNVKMNNFVNNYKTYGNSKNLITININNNKTEDDINILPIISINDNIAENINNLDICVKKKTLSNYKLNKVNKVEYDISKQKIKLSCLRMLDPFQLFLNKKEKSLLYKRLLTAESLLNMSNLISRLQEIDLIKNILFEEDQLVLVENLNKLEPNIEEMSFAYNKLINKENNLSKNKRTNCNQSNNSNNNKNNDDSDFHDKFKSFYEKKINDKVINKIK